MADSREFEGKDLEEALQAASDGLGIAEPDLDYEITQQGRPGLFGLGAKSVHIRVMPPITQTVEERGKERERPPRPSNTRPRRQRRSAKREPAAASKRKTPPRQASPASPEQTREVERTVQRMLDLMQLELTARAIDGGPGVKLEIDGRDGELLSENDGELTLALQFVLNRMSRRAWPGLGRVQLASNGGADGRDEELVELTRKTIEEVEQNGRPQRLRPMNAYERRLVHLTVRERAGLGSRSEGDGHLKRVRIFPL